MPKLWAKTLDYDHIEVGDDLPILVKHEDQQSIDLYAKLASTAPRANWNNLHTDEEFAKGGHLRGYGEHGGGHGGVCGGIAGEGISAAEVDGTGQRTRDEGDPASAGRRHDNVHGAGDGQRRRGGATLGGVRGDGD